MNKPEEISRLNRALIDAEVKIKTIFSNIEALSKEIKILCDAENSLEENLKCLKKNKIIAVAQEFKKSKEELKKIKSRIAMLTNDKTHFVKVSVDTQDFIDKTKAQITKLHGTEENNVLQFKRGDKDGQE